MTAPAPTAQTSAVLIRDVLNTANDLLVEAANLARGSSRYQHSSATALAAVARERAVSRGGAPGGGVPGSCLRAAGAGTTVMTRLPQPLVPGATGDATCPLPGCTEPLYITWAASRGIAVTDHATDLYSPADADSATWSIGCTQGHVVLLPPDTGGDYYRFGYCSGHAPGEDTEAEIAACSCQDAARLRILLSGTVPVSTAEQAAGYVARRYGPAQS